MPTDTEKLSQNKDTIVSFISKKGPSLPVHIAREVNLNLLFASAYLSELYNERRIRMSNMKVGSSSLYYLQGQEAMLENFVQYLNNKEKEALSLLKKDKVLEDDKLEPAIRVAIRAIKDFAIPLRIKIENDLKLFWKFFLISDDEVKDILQFSLLKKTDKNIKEENLYNDNEKQKTLLKEPEEVKKEIKELKVEEKKIIDSEIDKKIKEVPKELEKPEILAAGKKERKKKVIEESKFVKNVKDYLSSKDIEILEIKDEKKKDFMAKIRIDTLFGKQEYLLIAKDKRKLSEEDFTIALHKSQTEKMPALFVSPGEIDKKALDHAKLWKNLVKFEKVKF